MAPPPHEPRRDVAFWAQSHSVRQRTDPPMSAKARGWLFAATAAILVCGVTAMLNWLAPHWQHLPIARVSLRDRSSRAFGCLRRKQHGRAEDRGATSAPR